MLVFDLVRFLNLAFDSYSIEETGTTREDKDGEADGEAGMRRRKRKREKNLADFMPE